MKPEKLIISAFGPYAEEIEIDFESDWIEKVYDDIAKNRKIKKVRGYTDYDRVMDVFFNDIFDGNIGKITWEKPDGTL